MTWRLHRIVLYSHKLERHLLPEAGFKPIGVNIIVGDSNTGKSAILEIVNYCLGSTNCEVADYIRQRCSWVGIQLRRDDQYLLICRMIPVGSRKTSTSYFLKTGKSDELPASKDALRDMGAGTIDRLDQLIGIGSIKLEDSTNPTGFSVSARHCVPYSLMRDDVIISKDAIISGARDDRARHLRETLPYFLGHITEETIRQREELRRRRGELRGRQAEFDQRQALVREGSLRLSSFVDKGRSLGMIPPARGGVETPDEQRALLLDVARFRADVKGAPPDSELHALDQTLREGRRKLVQLQEHRRAVRQTASDAGTFWSAAAGQFARLAVIDLLTDEHDARECPVCSADLKLQAESPSVLRAAMEKLRQDIGEVNYDRPRLDSHLVEVEKEIDALRAQQERMSKRVEELVRLDAAFERERGLDEARFRLAGQVDLFLETAKVEDLTAEAGELQRLKAQIARLEGEVGRGNVKESMDDDAVILSAGMKDVIGKLPFAATYKSAIPIFDWKNLQVHLLVDGSRKVMMPSIGSDENYLAIHIAFFLSIQKLFAERRKPVLQFVILDQVTRPYFPDTDFKQIVDLTSSAEVPAASSSPTLSDERAKVKRIVGMLFAEAAMPNAPQVIICEKATFRDDPAYTNAIVAVWATPNGMVPSDWAASTA